MPDRSKRRPSLARALVVLCRNLLFAVLLYALVVGVILLAKTPSRSKGRLGIPSVLDKSGPADILGTTRSGVQVKFAASRTPVTINPHANVFNRPSSLVVAKDDYLGPRPHVDTVADLGLLVSECRGSYAGMEKVKNIFNCLKFLSTGQERYFSLPPIDQRASQSDPKTSEYLNSDGLNNTSQIYVGPESATAPSNRSIGTCAGPVIPYHTYWSGPATWRLEIFIKSYLYSQNLACARLHIWLDEDRRQSSVSRMLTKDPLFARFLPFVERGDITLETWTFPSRIPIPKHQVDANGIVYYKNPAKPNSKGETSVADGIIEDSTGQQWLVLTPKEMALLPQPVSEAVRYIILHLHGGVFFEVDVLMLRDMRPLMLAEKHSFASRWAAHLHPGDFNNAVFSLSANSSLSSYLLYGAIRMGLNFHPRVIGRMAWKDGRDQELIMLESAVFDPLWTEANREREGKCTVPCLKEYSSAFNGKPNVLKEEWESYDGPHATHIDIDNPPSLPQLSKPDQRLMIRDATVQVPPQGQGHEPYSPFAATSDEEAELRRAGAISEYDIEEDRFPPNNRTLENFYAGAWSYHVHDQWIKHPEPSSWLSVIEHAHDAFFSRQRTNMYGEDWRGPTLMSYYLWPEFV